MRRGWPGSSPLAWAKTERPDAGCFSVKLTPFGHSSHVLDFGMS